jgi:F-type H+-transporting ATPase subunit delta
MSGVIAQKYARALFDSAMAEEKLPVVAEGMRFLVALREEDPAFLEFLVSPEVLTEHKVEFIRKVFGPRLDPMIVNFLFLLVDKGRIDLLPGICRGLIRLVEEHQGLLRAEVVTAHGLEAGEEKRLKEELDRITGKNVILEKRIDPSLIGGVIVHLGDRIIDRSLKRGLKVLSDRLMQAQI